MIQKAEIIDTPVKHGRFLLSRRTFRTNVLIYSLTWTSLALILCAVIFQPQSVAGLWWVVLVTFFNTIAVGLSHREMLRLTIQQELEILAESKNREGDAKSSKLQPTVETTKSLFEGSGPDAKREDLVRH